MEAKKRGLFLQKVCGFDMVGAKRRCPTLEEEEVKGVTARRGCKFGVGVDKEDGASV